MGGKHDIVLPTNWSEWFECIPINGSKGLGEIVFWIYLSMAWIIQPNEDFTQETCELEQNGK